MLAGARRGDRPLGMQGIWQGDVYRIDIAIGEQCLIGVEMPPIANSSANSRALAESRLATARHRDARGGTNALDETACDVRGAQNADAQRRRKCLDS